MHTFLGPEMESILIKKGPVLQQLKAFTAEGIEKNIFKKYLRRKYPIISYSKERNLYRAILQTNYKQSRRNRFRKNNYRALQIGEALYNKRKPNLSKLERRSYRLSRHLRFYKRKLRKKRLGLFSLHRKKKRISFLEKKKVKNYKWKSVLRR